MPRRVKACPQHSIHDSGDSPGVSPDEQKTSSPGLREVSCDWIRKMWYIYTMEYYSAIKKNDIMPFAATWMELENLILSEMSQKDKDKYHMISLITGI
uniref:DUF1725 domain-containing protein n=1 Tax=Sus scrofa TaxID=9823 RepID=A0A8D1KSU9_PIG